MSNIDWLVLSITLSGIILYGMWKSRNMKNIEGYLLADRELPWYHVGLSVMATQASAITFLAGPGMGFSDGLRFVQFYFGLPLAMIVLCVTFIPIFHKLNVYTAYEYLEKRFDSKTRSFTAFLFLLQRGLSTGITIYAPAIVLSIILHIDIFYTTFIMGSLVIMYTVYGGTKAVSYTQLLQMIIIFSGLIVAFIVVIYMLPGNVSLSNALHIAGKSAGRTNAIDTNFAWDNQFNIWSGIIGGFFLQLSYFGTDQSQVGRYLTGKSIAQSRLGLIMNGLIKIPMQFFILLIGVLVFSFYQFTQPPLFFNPVELEKLEKSEYKENLHDIQQRQTVLFNEKQYSLNYMNNALNSDLPQAVELGEQHLQRINGEELKLRAEFIALVKKNSGEEPTDTNYVFLSFVTTYLPVGLVGVLIAIIFLAAMGSTASGLNSLAATTVIDFHKRFSKKEYTPQQYVTVSRWYTLAWGVFCMIVAFFASRVGNLIVAVNELGSYFYGTILGIFMVAFYLKWVRGNAVFYAALLAEAFVVVAGLCKIMAFLWLNVLGCLLVMVLAVLIEYIFHKQKV